MINVETSSGGRYSISFVQEWGHDFGPYGERDVTLCDVWVEQPGSTKHAMSWLTRGRAIFHPSDTYNVRIARHKALESALASFDNVDEKCELHQAVDEW